MIDKDYSFKLDIKNISAIPKMEFVRGDLNTSVLNITLTENRVPIDLTGYTPTAVFKKPDNTRVIEDVTIINATKGLVRVVLSTQTIAAIGEVLGTIALTNATGDKVTFPLFKFKVRENLDNVDEIIESTNEFPILTKLIAENQQIKDNVVDDIQELQQQVSDLQGFIGYTDDDIVGVEADFVNRKFTRLAGAINRTPGAGFDDIKAFGGRKRCILTDDGVVLAYYGEPGYSETGATTTEIIKNSVTYPVGTPVQVMVEQPKFYYKVVPLQLEEIQDGKGYHMRKARYYVCDTPKAGFKVHPAFVRNGVEVDKIYLSAYEGSIYDVSAGTYLLADEQVADFNADKLSSIAYAKPASGLTQNLTRANTRKLANNRGNGWQISDVLSVSVTQMLFIIEYASFNTQDKIGLGVVNKTDNGSTNTNMSELTGATSNLGNASGMADGTNGLTSVSYRGEENFWGNIWKWVDGLNIFNQSDLYVANHGFADDTNQEPYKDAGITLSKTSGYISAFGYNEEFDWLFFPSETKGDSALPVGDNFYQTTALNAWRVALLGGLWDYVSSAGGFCWSMNGSSVNRYCSLGGRLLYVPQ